MSTQFKPGDRVIVQMRQQDDGVVCTIIGTAFAGTWVYFNLVPNIQSAIPASYVKPFLPLATTRSCPYCYKLSSTVRVRELCTTFGGEYDLFDSCLPCFEDWNAYYKEQVAKGHMS